MNQHDCVDIGAGFASQSCSYLLAADVQHGHFSLVLSPDGLTLITMDTSIMVAWDRRLYVNMCQEDR